VVGRQTTTRAGRGGVNPTARAGGLGPPRPPTRLGISWYCEEKVCFRVAAFQTLSPPVRRAASVDSRVSELHGMTASCGTGSGAVVDLGQVEGGNHRVSSVVYARPGCGRWLCKMPLYSRQGGGRDGELRVLPLDPPRFSPAGFSGRDAPAAAACGGGGRQHESGWAKLPAVADTGCHREGGVLVRRGSWLAGPQVTTA
jgi:hypothetical protein